MAKREMDLSPVCVKTKAKIKYEATKLFALKGFDAVSIRNIGRAVGIKASSIYSHYASKEALLEDIFENFETLYLEYFAWLTEENKKATSLEEVMDNMFEELINIRETPTYYEIALVNREQFNNKSARNKVFKLFHEDSIRFMQRDFDSLVEREIIPPCNTKMIATVFMHSVLIGNDMRLYEIMKQEIPIDATQMYIDLKELITSMLKNGV